MRTALRIAAATRIVASLGMAALGCGGCGEDTPESSDAGTSSRSASSNASASGGDGGLEATACGGYAWGTDWPPATAPAAKPVLLEPLREKKNCGPGCRAITTRLDLANVKPYEMSFAGDLMASRAYPQASPDANYADLSSAEEFAAHAIAPEPNTLSYLQSTMGPDCIAKGYTFYDDAIRRSYICQVCAHIGAQRLLTFDEGIWNDGSVDTSVAAASARYVVVSQNNGFYVLDVADGSRHPLADSLYFVTEISVFDPYIVLPEADGDVYVMDTRTWSKTNVTSDPALQYMASSDGKRIAWIDYRYSTDGTAAEVVVYDIQSKQLIRVTSTQASPSGKFYPTVEGDWVAWMDDRDSSAVNASIDTPRDRFDIYGYNLTSKQETHLVGNQAGEVTKLYPVLPQLHQGKIYVVGNEKVAPDVYYVQLYEFLLPEAN
ncbi:MAG: hypothetical protein WKG00_29245 [Polyangiaceae bacterium]